ncbi:MAG TPA: dihydrodipicolinate reductase C-terminal domain-containing protein, partial [Terriglobales bacterium]|nr:dihydrodipicolinate reductase C-terminal domain-containing protein [Terriglobales bacterium]
MNFLVLGRGKTGSLVAQCAKGRHHHVRVLGADENANGKALTPELLRDVNIVIDFTSPTAVLRNIEACLREKKNMVVGTTGWHAHAGSVRSEVGRTGVGFLHGANFSVGVNLFFETVRSASEALKHKYSGQIFERHHQQKKDAPSGTSLVLQRII